MLSSIVSASTNTTTNTNNNINEPSSNTTNATATSSNLSYSAKLTQNTQNKTNITDNKVKSNTSAPSPSTQLANNANKEANNSSSILSNESNKSNTNLTQTQVPSSTNTSTQSASNAEYLASAPIIPLSSQQPLIQAPPIPLASYQLINANNMLPPPPTTTTLIGAGNILQHQPLQPPPHPLSAQTNHQIYFPNYQPGHVFIPAAQFNVPYNQPQSQITDEQTNPNEKENTGSTESDQVNINSTTPNNANNTTTPSSSSNNSAAKSKLNPFAGEFIPTYSPQQQPQLAQPPAIQIITTTPIHVMPPSFVPQGNFEFQPQQQQQPPPHQQQYGPPPTPNVVAVQQIHYQQGSVPGPTNSNSNLQQYK